MGGQERNMQPQHAIVATRRGLGEWESLFPSKTIQNRYFDIFMIAHRKIPDDRKGKWFLYREVELSSQKILMKNFSCSVSFNIYFWLLQ
jgi:hypothetical protein